MLNEKQRTDSLVKNILKAFLVKSTFSLEENSTQVLIMNKSMIIILCLVTLGIPVQSGSNCYYICNVIVCHNSVCKYKCIVYCSGLVPFGLPSEKTVKYPEGEKPDKFELPVET
ncbi:uncharacterized protein LOC143239189 isoform X2 [Tachypleus tridentatus]|uniref:uncharacterized protein LOC143239056 isoform X2 n=1 Tax=Tachypleus tridentatus TaxID=6853 RepID=UPI003FCF70F9